MRLYKKYRACRLLAQDGQVPISAVPSGPPGYNTKPIWETKLDSVGECSEEDASLPGHAPTKVSRPLLARFLAIPAMSRAVALQNFRGVHWIAIAALDWAVARFPCLRVFLLGQRRRARFVERCNGRTPWALARSRFGTCALSTVRGGIRQICKLWLRQFCEGELSDPENLWTYAFVFF